MNQYQSVYERAVALGRYKLSPGDLHGRVLGPRIGTGGDFSGIFLWDTAFCIFWMRYHQDLFPCTTSLDNFYRLQEEDGCIHREYDWKGNPVWPKDHPITFAPPLLAWAELGLYEVNKDQDRLSEVYPILKKHYQWCKKNFQKENGLYFGDALGSGMDNLPRYPRGFNGADDALKLNLDIMPEGIRAWLQEEYMPTLHPQWNKQGSFIDMSSQVAFNAKNLAEISQILGLEDEGFWISEYDFLKQLINEKCWCHERNFYFDLDENDQIIERYHIGGFWPLIAEIVHRDDLVPYLRYLHDRSKFNRRVPVPSLAADDPDYHLGGDYWVGSSWPCTTYMVLKGLHKYGQHQMAVELAEQYMNAVNQIYEDTNTIWENISPEEWKPGSHSAPDFCGWGGLGPVAIVREFLVQEA